MTSRKPRRWRLSCSEETFRKLSEDERFRGLLTLARVVNALRFCREAMPDGSRTPRPSDQRQTINGFLFSCSVLYEGIQTVKKLNQTLHEYPSYQSGLKELLRDKNVARLETEYLNPMRKKGVFHFDIDVPESILEKIDLPEYNFATGSGQSSGEVYFDLADEVFVNYVMPPKDGESDEKLGIRHKQKMKEVRDLTGRFVMASEQLIADALKTMGFSVSSEQNG